MKKSTTFLSPENVTLSDFIHLKIYEYHSHLFYCNLTLSLLVATFITADNLRKQFDPDQALQNVRPDLDPNCLTL